MEIIYNYPQEGYNTLGSKPIQTRTLILYLYCILNSLLMFVIHFSSYINSLFRNSPISIWYSFDHFTETMTFIYIVSFFAYPFVRSFASVRKPYIIAITIGPTFVLSLIVWAGTHVIYFYGGEIYISASLYGGGSVSYGTMRLLDSGMHVWTVISVLILFFIDRKELKHNIMSAHKWAHFVLTFIVCMAAITLYPLFHSYRDVYKVQMTNIEVFAYMATAAALLAYAFHNYLFI